MLFSRADMTRGTADCLRYAQFGPPSGRCLVGPSFPNFFDKPCECRFARSSQVRPMFAMLVGRHAEMRLAEKSKRGLSEPLSYLKHINSVERVRLTVHTCKPLAGIRVPEYEQRTRVGQCMSKRTLYCVFSQGLLDDFLLIFKEIIGHSTMG